MAGAAPERRDAGRLPPGGPAARRVRGHAGAAVLPDMPGPAGVPPGPAAVFLPSEPLVPSSARARPRHHRLQRVAGGAGTGSRIRRLRRAGLPGNGVHAAGTVLPARDALPEGAQPGRRGAAAVPRKPDGAGRPVRSRHVHRRAGVPPVVRHLRPGAPGPAGQPPGPAPARPRRDPVGHGLARGRPARPVETVRAAAAGGLRPRPRAGLPDRSGPRRPGPAQGGRTGRREHRPPDSRRPRAPLRHAGADPR